MSHNILFACIFSALGALAHLASIHLSEAHLNARTIISHLTISLFTAALMAAVALRFGWKIYGLCIGCGLAAWMGAKLLSVFEDLILDRLRKKQ